MEPCNLRRRLAFQLAVDAQPITCAFTIDELTRLVDWGNRNARVADLQPDDVELLERIKRLVAAARERQRLRSV
jgi:hypothetical protein